MPKLINLQGHGATEDHEITEGELIQMALDYRNHRHALIAKHGNNPNDARTCYLAAEVYAKILEKCDGIRTYYGLRQEKDGKYYHTLMLVGTRNKQDALNDDDYVALVKNPGKDEDPDLLYDWGSLCPPDCGDHDTNSFLHKVDKL
ncbi:hypothetical protein [Rufibacter sp. LB8]|uniref:hypothetical protein n=1 Tax=Rufibacter sp. LB8 TaxID=2777781 RepID=UPI00178C725E|nr:hypothetical protein [Rufibacter sp. LB8]